MKRIVPFILAFALVVVAATWTSPRDGDAQDTDGSRIDALETRIANQGAALIELEDRLENLEGSAPKSSGQDGTNRTASESLTIEGSGTTVTDKFTLSPGNYKVTAELDVTAGFSGFIMTIYGSDDQQETVLNELIQVNGPWSIEAVFEAGAGGEFYVEVSNTDEDWTVTFEPL